MTDDLISRQAVIAEFNCCELTPDGGIDANDAIDILERLPSAQPVRHGKWIDETFESWGLVHHPFKCNLCGEHAEFASPYCPNCGAKMDGELEGKSKK